MTGLVRTPLGKLATAVLIAVAVLSGMSLYLSVTAGNTLDRVECVTRQLAEPWKGLRASFKAPPGDLDARDLAAKAIDRGIDRVDHLDKVC